MGFPGDSAADLHLDIRPLLERDSEMNSWGGSEFDSPADSCRDSTTDSPRDLPSNFRKDFHGDLAHPAAKGVFLKRHGQFCG
jgi:hypothetical protein